MLVLSVIIPVYNVEEFLVSCLNSVNNAIEGLDAEVILVNDGSEDSSGLIAKEYSDSHEAFSYHEIEHGGLSKARNYGVDIAKGKYISFVDSDDIICPNIYRNMIAAATYHNADIVSCDLSRLNGERWLPSPLHQLAFNKVQGPVVNIRDHTQLVFDTLVCNKIFLREFFDENNFVFPEGELFEDMHLGLMAQYYSRCTVILKEFGYLWRVRNSDNKSITQNKDLSSLKCKIKQLSSMLDFANSYIQEKSIKDKLNFRILLIDLEAYIDEIKHYSDEEAKAVLTEINNFFDKHINMNVVSELSIYHQRKIELIREYDINGIRRLLNYRRINYNNAQIFEEDSGYYVRLPKSIFNKEISSADSEFKNYPLPEYIDSLEISETGVKLHGHIFAGRINTPDIDSISLSAGLYNEITGEVIKLPVSNELCPMHTAAKGKVLSYDDYIEYSYNYDGSGFCLELNPNEWPAEELKVGEYYILLDYIHPVDKGQRVVRGLNDDNKNNLTNTSFIVGDKEVRFRVDPRQSIIIDVK